VNDSSFGPGLLHIGFNWAMTCTGLTQHIDNEEHYPGALSPCGCASSTARIRYLGFTFAMYDTQLSTPERRRKPSTGCTVRHRFFCSATFPQGWRGLLTGFRHGQRGLDLFLQRRRLSNMGSDLRAS
jgi:hypothetical protein